MKTQPTVQTDPSHFECRHCRAIDGDTMEAQIVLPFGVTITRRIRLKGFLAPEHNGSQPAVAHAAQEALQRALDAHQVHLVSRGSKDDKYGRLVAHILLDHRAADPYAVLGACQLCPDEHQRDLVFARRSASSARGAL